MTLTRTRTPAPEVADNTGATLALSRIRASKGFTLIELIVVVIIIGVLAAIAALAYNQFVASARETALKASALQAEKAIAAQTAQADEFNTDTVATAGGTVTGAVVGNLSGGYVKVVQTGSTNRAACLFYGSNPAPGANATSIEYGTLAALNCGGSVVDLSADLGGSSTAGTGGTAPAGYKIDRATGGYTITVTGLKPNLDVALCMTIFGVKGVSAPSMYEMYRLNPNYDALNVYVTDTTDAKGTAVFYVASVHINGYSPFNEPIGPTGQLAGFEPGGTVPLAVLDPDSGYFVRPGGALPATVEAIAHFA